MFTILEKDLCTRIGISREILREFRQKHLFEDTDWILVGSQVVLTRAGVKKALKYLQTQITQNVTQGANSPEKVSTCPLEPLTRALQQPALFADEKKRATLMVCTLYRNPRIIGALDPEDPDRKVLRVRVKNGRNFIRGMKIPCEHVELGLWQLLGRCPRARGRW